MYLFPGGRVPKKKGNALAGCLTCPHSSRDRPMRSSVWVSLIRIFPPEIQEKLMAVMTSGNEINISGVIRFEQDFLVVRGRLAGTTDDAGVVFVPYDRIDYIGFRVPMKDQD